MRIRAALGRNGKPTNRLLHGCLGGVRIYQGWMVVVAGFFLVLILYGAYYCFGVFLKPMLSELGWTRAMTSGAFSTYMVTHGAFAIIAGLLSDKFGAQAVVVAGTLLVGLGYGLVSLISVPWHFYVCFGLMVGIGMGTAYVPPVSIVTRWFVSRKGLALGIVASGVGVGQMVMPPLVKYWINAFGWRTSFIIVGIMVCLIGVPAALLLRQPPSGMGRPTDSESDITAKKSGPTTISQEEWTVREAVTTLSFALLLGIFAAFVFGVSIVAAHLVAHVEDTGIAPVPAALVLTMMGGSGIFGRIVMGWVADKTGSRIILVACMILLTSLLLLLIWAKDLWLFYTIAAFFGMAYGGVLPVMIKMSSDFFGIRSTGSIFGILIFGATMSGAIGVPLAGYVYDTTGNYSAAFLIGGIIMAAGSILSFIVKSPEKAKS